MTKICDNTSVGMFVWQEDKLLLIERKRFPFGFAVPAGHIDGDESFEVAAKRELKEEVGLDSVGLKLIAEGRKENPCRREGGSWHYWKLYRVEFEGKLDPSQDETKKVDWFSKQDIEELSKRTEEHLNGNTSEEHWEKVPGLEPVMYDWFKELEII